MFQPSDSQLVDYPLDPLGADEFRSVAAILHREYRVRVAPTSPTDLGWRYASIEMIEPSKAELAAFEDGGPPPPRRAEAICFNGIDNATYKSVVSLSDDRVEAFEHIPGVQSNFTVGEFLECDQVLRLHPDVIAAVANRGITDLDLVFFDTWTYGDAVAPPEFRDRRIGWSDSWVKDKPGANPYARMLSGLHCIIDLNTMELLRIEDDGPFATGEASVPEVMGEYVPGHIPERILASTHRENTDVVLWYVFGIHHITRPEDWPVMPVDVVSFWLKPFGFFERNPSLDVAEAPPAACHASTNSARH